MTAGYRHLAATGKELKAVEETHGVQPLPVEGSNWERIESPPSSQRAPPVPARTAATGKELKVTLTLGFSSPPPPSSNWERIESDAEAGRALEGFYRAATGKELKEPSLLDRAKASQGLFRQQLGKN